MQKPLHPLPSCHGNVFDAGCPARSVLEILAEKWALLLVHTLAGGPARTAELRRRIGGISDKMLIQTLRRLDQPDRTLTPEIIAIYKATPEEPNPEEFNLHRLLAMCLGFQRDPLACDVLLETIATFKNMETRAAAMDALAALPQIAQVLARGPTRATVLIGRAAVQCDVRAVAPSSYGAALQYFTGNKDHNVRLRELAVRRGLRINEYGVYDVATERRLGGATEEEVYAAVGLPWIPPEIREGQGEIEAAQQGTLPALVTLHDIRGDLHMHTQWSDGKDTAEVMARAAAARGYEYCCITDHSQSLKFARGVTVEDLRAHAASVRALSDSVGIRVLMGAEVDILGDGTLDYPDDVLRELDLVIASVHSRFAMPRDEMTRRVVRALEHPRLDVLGHPTGRLIGRRPGYDLDIEAVIEAARRTDTALEINASPDRLDLPDVHVRLARERGVLVAVDTDAHQKAHLDFMPFGVGTARRGWTDARHVINAWPLPTLLEFLAR